MNIVGEECLGRNCPASTVLGSLLLFLHHGVPPFILEYHQPHPTSSHLLAESHSTVFVPVSQQLYQFWKQFSSSSVDAWEPICEKGCSCLVIPQPELSPHDYKQICCGFRGKLVIDTEKSVVWGRALGQKECVDSARKSQHFMSRPSKDLPLFTSTHNFPVAYGEEEYSPGN